MKHRSRFLPALFLGAFVLASRGAPAEAPGGGHWAFQPVRDPAPPEVRDAAWCRTSIDRFILAPLEAAGRTPARAADRRTLIRRAAFDLTGLPPTADEVDAFVSDAGPRAWERWVDRLLESPRYGEHWGRHWLDVVRYADTAGETADYPVPVAWRYRNYVIDAFNTDKPYDVFLREQIAGDLLAREGDAARYAERVTATGYLAISRRFGFDSENYHHLTLQDTIDNVGQSVLGLTLGCARCHAHKYDPVSMADYYALYGIFESTRYAFPGSEQKQRHRALVPLAPVAESQARWREFEVRVAALTEKVAGAKLPVPAAGLHSLDDLDGDFEMQAPAAGGSKGVLVPPWVYEGPISVATDAQSPFRNLHPLGRVGASVAAGTRDYRIAQALPAVGRRADRAVAHVNLDFRIATNAPAGAARHRFALTSRSGEPLVEILLSPTEAFVRIGPREERIRALVPGQWHSLQLVLDLGASTVAGAVARPGEVVEFAVRPLAGKGELERVVLGRAAERSDKSDESDKSDGGLPGVAWDNLAVEAVVIPPVSTNLPALVGPPLPEDPAVAKRELEALLVDGPCALAYAVSEGTPGHARVQRRGEPDQPAEVVPRGTLPVLGGGPLPETVRESGRRELADWLASPANPLTARVMVNRIWQYHFGAGLVRTPNDFGTRGRRPSHPELLDHLATEFIRSGWSIKAMHRLILASATYQQQSRFSPDPAARAAAPPPTPECPVVPAGTGNAGPRTGAAGAEKLDETELFSPFGRRRLAAEETRDAILLVSGTLEATPGTGHPFPSPTGWGYTQHGPFAAVYDHSHRSVYLMTQRLKRHPFLALFDGADPNASTAERRTSIVPTQALYFLNDPFVHASGEKLAERVLAESTDPARRVDGLYRRVLGRSPDETERAAATAFLESYRRELAATGGTEVGAMERMVHAAWARVLLASNEFVTVD